jgi:PAS domain S-box-containing protein
MDTNYAYTVVKPKSTLKINIFLPFFLVLAIAWALNNIIFITIIQSVLSDANINTGLSRNMLRYFIIAGIGITLAGIAIIAFVSLYLSERITKPITDLTHSMTGIAKGRWNTRATAESNDEIGQLTQGFNFMASHVESTLQKYEAAKEYTDNILISVPSILIVLNSNSEILSTNLAYDNLHDQFPSLSPNLFIQQMGSEISNYLETGEKSGREIELSPEDTDAILIFSVTITGIGDHHSEPDEKTPRMLLTISDITARRKMKELVFQSRQDWEDTFNMIPDAITIHDRDYNIIQANKAAKEMLNLPVLDVLKNNKCFSYYHGLDYSPKECPSCNCYGSGKAATFEVFEPHLKKYIEVRSIPRLDNTGNVIGLIHITRDISARKKIEDEINLLLRAVTNAKVEWEVTFNSTSEHIVLINNQLEVTRFNQSFKEFVKKPMNDITGMKCYELFNCADDQVEICQKCTEDTSVYPGKIEIQTEDGRWLYVSHQPIRDVILKSLYMVVVATDITDLHSAQEKLKKSDVELKKKVDELEKFYDMVIGREIKMKELKKELKKLNAKLLQTEESSLVKN